MQVHPALCLVAQRPSPRGLCPRSPACGVLQAQHHWRSAHALCRRVLRVQDVASPPLSWAGNGRPLFPHLGPAPASPVNTRRGASARRVASLTSRRLSRVAQLCCAQFLLCPSHAHHPLKSSKSELYRRPVERCVSCNGFCPFHYNTQVFFFLDQWFVMVFQPRLPPQEEDLGASTARRSCMPCHSVLPGPPSPFAPNEAAEHRDQTHDFPLSFGLAGGFSDAARSH